MKHDTAGLNARHLQGHGTLRTYAIGFMLSCALTVAAYLIVVYPNFPTRILVAEIVALAIMQLLVQLVYFLHLDKEGKPRWNLVTFLFALMVVLILVFGSLWIMTHLNYHMMSPQEIIVDEGISR